MLNMLQFIITLLIAGLIATTGITLVLWVINKSGWTNADMVRAAGGFLTRSYENALRIGLVIHFLTGIVFAAVYMYVLSFVMLEIGLKNFVSSVALGGTLGFFQGFIVALAIVRFAYLHPLPEFQEADYKVAIAHIIGHIVYGMLLGLMFAVMTQAGINPGLLNS